jgi:hypothetical protein
MRLDRDLVLLDDFAQDCLALVAAPQLGAGASTSGATTAVLRFARAQRLAPYPSFTRGLRHSENSLFD